jgi:hypothetical protein
MSLLLRQQQQKQQGGEPETQLYHEMISTYPTVLENGRRRQQQQLLLHVHYFDSIVQPILSIRGGGADEEESDEESDDDDEESSSSSGGIDYAALMEQVTDVTKTKVVPVVMTASKKTYKVMKKVAISTYRAFQRAIRAGLEGSSDDDEEEAEVDNDEETEVTMFDQVLKIATKAAKTIKRMVEAALDFPEDEEDADEDSEGDGEDDDEGPSPEVVEVDVIVEDTNTRSKLTLEKDGSAEDVNQKETAEAETKFTKSEGKDPDVTTTEASISIPDFGSFLAEAYHVDDQRNAKHNVLFMGGTFRDALETANQQARMLIVYIPAERPNGRRGLFGGGKKGSDDLAKDKMVIENLLSTKVAKAANKKARKNGEDTGSFIIWGAKAGSSEASNVMKRLKVTHTSNKGEKRPILCVVYPANLVSGFGHVLTVQIHSLHDP